MRTAPHRLITVKSSSPLLSRSSAHGPIRIFQKSPNFSNRSLMSAPSAITLISFDVDGTLIHSIGLQANKLHKDSFAYGLKAVHDLNTHIDVIKHHGSTDPLIVVSVLEHHGIKKEVAMEKLKAVEETMNKYFLEKAAEEAAVGIEILPGVKDLLTALQAASAATCLVTGNLEPIGWAKMKALGIDTLFSEPRFGGFGSDFCSGNTLESWKDRGELVKIAAKKGNSSVPGAAGGFAARYHVGDTPMDILAALAAGAKAVGVTTGVFSKEELLACIPEGTPEDQVIILSSLVDTQAVLKAMGLSNAVAPS